MPAGRGLQRTPAVTTGPKEPQVRPPTQPPPGSPSGGGPEFESPHPKRSWSWVVLYRSLPLRYQLFGDLCLALQPGQSRLLVHPGHLLAGGQALAHDCDDLAVGPLTALTLVGRRETRPPALTPAARSATPRAPADLAGPGRPAARRAGAADRRPPGTSPLAGPFTLPDSAVPPVPAGWHPPRRAGRACRRPPPHASPPCRRTPPGSARWPRWTCPPPSAPAPRARAR
jgi:hypothetical protein